jgi:hypothetical protein
MKQKNVKIFYKPVDGGELKELECVAESNGFEFEPLEESIDVKCDPTPFTSSLSFEIDSAKCNIRKLLYTRVPRKKKKWQKKQVAMIDGKPVKHLRYDYLGCYYWIK